MQHAHRRVALVSHTAAALRSQGFTMVELVITIAVAAILLAMAIPGFTSIVNSNRLASAANEMVATLQTARMEAIRRNRTVTVCDSADGIGCAGEGSWIVLDADGNLLRVSTFNTNVQSNVVVDEFIFRADGLARATAASGLLTTDFEFCIDTTMPVQNVRTVSLGSGSRISTAPEEQACP